MDPADPGGHAAAKAALRRTVLARRVDRVRADPAGRAADGRAVERRLAEVAEVAGLRAGDTVAAYLELATELPLAATRDALHRRGIRVVVPVLLDDGDLDWTRWDPAGTGGPTGARLGRGTVAGAAVVLLPGVAADRAGGRLGRGGGSYDRALARLARLARPPGPRPWTCLVLYADEVVESVPVESHDVAVDAVVTPAGLLRVRGPDEHRVPGPDGRRDPGGG